MTDTDVLFDPYEFDDSGRNREGGRGTAIVGEVNGTAPTPLPVPTNEPEFDPYLFTTPKPPKQYKSAEEKFRPSLVARARKRTVKQVKAGAWVVEGEHRFGDSMGEYEVTFNGRVYDCDCYHTSHGESRARRVCSHVLAVILFREQLRGVDGNGPVGESPTEVEVNESQSHSSNNGGRISAPALETNSELVKQLPLPPAEDEEPSCTPPAQVSACQSIGPEQEITTPHESVRPPQEISLVQVSDGVPDVNDPRWGIRPLPEKFVDIRPHQWDAVQEIVEAYRSGSKLVWLDAPTGTGKTLVAELVRRELDSRASYVCSSISLQEQFLRDFQYAKLLKGRSNYPTLDFPFPEYTAGDCTKTPGQDDCLWCNDVHACPYEKAKSEALGSELAVVNTSYLLNEANYVGRLSGRPLGIVDECDVLEKELMGFVEFQLSSSRLDRLKAPAPKKGSHKATLANWLDDDLRKALLYRLNVLGGQGDNVRAIRERQGLQRLYQETVRISLEMRKSIEHGEEYDIWVRDYPRADEEAFILKPTKIDRYGPDMLWRHADRWLCMSATIISAQELSDSLGLREGWSVVRVPMTFPVENRRVNVAPVADMANKYKPQNQEQMAKAIGKVLDRHPGERVLIHTVSYDLTKLLAARLRASHPDRRIVTYEAASGREQSLRQFRSGEAAVLLAPSMDRGIDLVGDECRVVVVAKVPFPYLGDSQVNARMKLPGGQGWYTVQTIRSLVQMTGRAVRSADDWAVSYILDRQFVSNIWKKSKELLPTWWRESLNMQFPTRELL